MQILDIIEIIDFITSFIIVIIFFQRETKSFFVGH